VIVEESENKIKLFLPTNSPCKGKQKEEHPRVNLLLKTT
jgi:hypothetical protein